MCDFRNSGQVTWHIAFFYSTQILAKGNIAKEIFLSEPIRRKAGIEPCEEQRSAEKSPSPILIAQTTQPVFKRKNWSHGKLWCFHPTVIQIEL